MHQQSVTMQSLTTAKKSQDLDYMGLTVEQLTSVNPRLPSLIAHDRAGFGRRASLAVD